MAILEKETNHYYKVEFDECMIKGLSVYVAYSTYRTSGDREKEKIRRPQLTAFLTAMQQRLFTLDEEINSAVKSMGLTPADIVDAEGRIKEDNFPELRAKQNELLALSPVPHEVFDRFYSCGDGEKTKYEYSVPKKVLEGYGYDEIWITDPVCLSMKAQVYCGEYDGEPITPEFYYNRLKPYMNENIEDC